MKKTTIGWAAIAVLFLGTSAVIADNATLHGQNLRREGTAIHMQNFDVTLDARTLTATDGVYHPDTGIVDLTRKVQLHFGLTPGHSPVKLNRAD